MSKSVRAVRVTSLRGPSSIEVLDMDAPERRRGETLVEVRAVAPAFPDLLMSEGKYQIKPDLPFSPGSDFAGVVIEPSEGSEFSRGDRVAGCLSYGAAAEVLAVPDDRLYPLPERLGFVEAAALPMNYLTSHFALVTRGDLRPGQWVMVLGASGGVGLASIQVASGLGARVIAVVSTAERAAVALSAGARHAVLRDDLPGSIRDLTDGRGVDIVVDVVGGDMTNALRCLAPLGRVLAVGFASGEIPTVKVNRLLLTNTDVRGVESDYLWQQGLSRKAWDELMDLVQAGHIAPVVRESGSLEAYGRALEELATRSVVGRTVLTV
jgi:NADPH2:quinone reductase